MSIKYTDSSPASAAPSFRARPANLVQRTLGRAASDQDRRFKDVSRSDSGCRSIPDQPASPPDILPRLGAGQPEAARELVDRYRVPIRALARNFTRDSADIDDAVQEVFVALWKNATKFDPTQSPEGAFVNLIARRRLIDFYRRKKRQIETIDDEPRFDVMPDRRAHEAEARVEAKLTAPVLGQLRAREREALLLSVYLGMSHTEIARHVNRPLGTVKTHIRRGLKRVREALDSVGSDAS